MNPKILKYEICQGDYLQVPIKTKNTHHESASFTSTAYYSLALQEF